MEKRIDPVDFKDTLEDAEHLLKYAAEIGIEIDGDTCDAVLEARSAFSTGWDETTAAHLLSALTRLVSRLKPVTAESLKASTNGQSEATGRRYWVIAIVLAVVIIPYSLASYVTSSISDSIRKDIVTANDLAVKLTTQLPTPVLPAGVNRSDVVSELQTFAATIRGIDSRSAQLNVFILRRVKDPFQELRPGFNKDANKARDMAKELKEKLQLPVPLPDDLSIVSAERISVYQDVRYYGQSVVDDVSVWYSAFATCILPVLYALLGTCVYLVRTFEQEISSRTFKPSHADFHRFLIAGVAGAVVGFFSNFAINTGTSVSPLAIAFLAGYAVDVFFSFLDGLMQTFTRNKNAAGAASSAATSGGNP
ncbi:MAG TPA: hypothetical protein VGK48_22610 [Terriglobia bacterium]